MHNSILDQALSFSNRGSLLFIITEKGFIKHRDKATMSPYIMAIWELQNMVEEGILSVETKYEGRFIFRKKFKVYKLKNNEESSRSER